MERAWLFNVYRNESDRLIQGDPQHQIVILKVGKDNARTHLVNPAMAAAASITEN